MLKGIWSWLGVDTGVRENVRPAGAPSFEPLEPRLLLDANLPNTQLLLTCDVPSHDQAVYVDLDGQEDSTQAGLSPVLTIDVASGERVDQPASMPLSSENAATRVGCGVVAESASSDSSVAMEDDAAGAVAASQQDCTASLDTLPIEIRGPPDGSQEQQASELFSVSPALFVENQGQWSDPSIRYAHDGNSVDVAMTDSAVIFQITKGGPAEEFGGSWLPGDQGSQDTNARSLQFSASFLGANQVQAAGLEQAGSLFNYYVGEQANWRQDIPSYEVVAYEGLYEGIDLYVQGLRSHLKYEFHVAPGADYSQIAVHYEGIEGLSIAEDGSLQVNLGAGRGVIRDDAPYIYQKIDGRKVTVAGRFVLLDNQTYSFEITGPINPDRALVIDPDLAWSTYLGGSSGDYGLDIAVDDLGNVYVTGYTESAGWTSGGFDTTHGGSEDVVVAKLSASGEHVWSTYLGGGGTDAGEDIVVDASANVYLTGFTTSSGWTSGGFDTTYSGGGDAFAAGLSASGQHLWSTYLGGDSDDYGIGIAADSLGSVYVVGKSYSSGWTSGGFETTYSGSGDAFVAKLSASGQHLWSTYLGGSGLDSGLDIAVDTSGDVYVTGATYSSGWTSGGFDTTHNGVYDAFVAKLSDSGAHLWSTYLGGSSENYGQGIAVDVSGSVYVAGTTGSSGWTSGGFDTTYDGEDDAFVAKLSSSGAYVWSTYLGGSGPEEGLGVGVAASGNVYVTGYTESAGWTNGGFDTTHNGVSDVFVVRLGSSGAHLWSTYLGGNNLDKGLGIAADSSGNIYVAGYTSSAGWTSGGFDTTYDGSVDAFVAKISDPTDMTPPTIGSVSISPGSVPLGGSFQVTYMVSDSGGSGLSSIELWRTNDLSTWQFIAQNSASGNGPVTGALSDTPGTEGNWWYRIQVFDAAINSTTQTPPLQVVVGLPDITPPSPNPSTWAATPYATGAGSVSMVATPATDVSGVEYYFHETSGNPGATDSGWQDSNTYEDTGLSPGTSYVYQVKTRDKSPSHNEGTYSISASATTPSPVYRFWSPVLSRHFYTISEAEKDKLINNYSHVWTYERVAYQAYADDTQPGVAPIYRFWSGTLNAHFYTMKVSERDKLISNYSQVWTYEGIAFYAYAAGSPPVGTSAVYRFWSGTLGCHFYTMSEAERDKLINLYPQVWTYESVAWYAYGV